MFLEPDVVATYDCTGGGTELLGCTERTFPDRFGAGMSEGEKLEEARKTSHWRNLFTLYKYKRYPIIPRRSVSAVKLSGAQQYVFRYLV